jgi:hypothetical protein
VHLPKVKSQGMVQSKSTASLDKAEAEAEDASVKMHVHELPLPANVEKRRLLVHHALETEEQDNLRLLTKIRERMTK